MFAWLKKLIPNPKALLASAIDALDLLVPLMATEMDKIKEQFNAMNSLEKSQWVVDKVQDYLRARFGINV